MEYLSDPLQITILKRNLDLQIMEHLMQSSKRHYSWHTLGTRLCHNESSHPDSEMDQWTLHDRNTSDTPISQDLKLCLFLSFHGSFPYDALRAKLVTWFQADTCDVHRFPDAGCKSLSQKGHFGVHLTAAC